MPRNETMNDNVTSELDVFKMTGRALRKGISMRFDAETLKKTHQYVLFNCDDVSAYIEQYRTVVEQPHPHVSRHQFECIHSETFADWFAQKVDEAVSTDDESLKARDLKLLDSRPNFIGLKYKKFLVNSFRFHTKTLESTRKTQNCGVRIKAATPSFSSTRDQNPILSDLDYYGILRDVIKLDYGCGRSIVLFDCDWVSSGSRLKKDVDGFTLAKFSNVTRHKEPFILASQAEQVFYVQDPTEQEWKVVVSTTARAHYNMESTIDVETYLQSNICIPPVTAEIGDFGWVREDVD
ncbi:hypothetical protein C2S51_008908 [Perilla frutescens var. frutescens]|nr:hypothetical protein C2S51_008908 [Perilla frutescens var. frutescens]